MQGSPQHGNGSAYCHMPGAQSVHLDEQPMLTSIPAGLSISEDLTPTTIRVHLMIDAT